MDNKLFKIESKLSGGIVFVMVMIGLLQVYILGVSMVFIGGGIYNGELVVVLGVLMVSVNGCWVYKL